MAVRGPKAQALAAEVADTATFVQLPGQTRVDVAQLARDFCAIRDVELALHVSVLGDTVAPFMAPPDTDPAALRASDSLAILPDDPAAAAEEIQRRREEIGFSYVVVGAAFADALAQSASVTPYSGGRPAAVRRMLSATASARRRDVPLVTPA